MTAPGAIVHVRTELAAVTKAFDYAVPSAVGSLSVDHRDAGAGALHGRSVVDGWWTTP